MTIRSGNPTISTMPSDVIIPIVPLKAKPWSKPTDQIDTWLDTQGFYRKHIARDDSSLFRCVSEQVFLTQVHHLTVRKHCIQFAVNQSEIFKQLTNVSTKEYIDLVHNHRKWGSVLDMEIISRLYNVDFAMYKEIKKPVEQITSNGNRSFIMLSLSYEHHYDSVYPKQHITNAAVCQSILYEMLYKDVFKLEEVDYAVNKMLHDKAARYQPDLSAALLSTGFQMRLEMRDTCRNVKDLLNCGITPFPYKVAKSLDPNIYRNVEYDTWNEPRKSMRHSSAVWNSKELQEGSKCWVNFKNENETIKRNGYIQKMSPNKGPVVVFIQELGEKVTVPFETLELIPSTSSCTSQTDSINDIFGVKMSTFAKVECNEIKPSYEILEENLENSDKIRETFQSNCVPSNFNSDLCSVQYMHSTSSTVPTTCYACISSHSFSSERQRSSPVDEHSKYNHTTQSTNENTSPPEQTVPIMQYPVSLYPVIPQDVEVQHLSYASNILPPKIVSNPNETGEATNTYRMYCNNNVDQYYRYGLPTVGPYYVISSPNYVYPLSNESPIQQNNDTQRIPYTPPTVSQHQNELLYAMPMNNLSSSKTDVPLYPSMITYPSPPPMRKVSSRSNNGEATANPADSQSYRPHKEMVYLKEPQPLNPNINITQQHSIPTNIYPYYNNPYSSVSPALYYHAVEYNGACYPTYSEMPSYPENITPPTYQVPHIVPVAYSEDMYPQNSQIICHQPLLPQS